MLDCCSEYTDIKTVDVGTDKLLVASSSEDVEEGEGMEGVDAACCTVLEGGGSGGVEETAVGTVIVVSLNRTSAM